MMKMLALAGIAGAMIGSAALADPVTRTITYDGVRYDGTKTVTRDREAGTVSKDWDVVRASDGATASRDYDRSRTDSGFVASGSRTQFDGDTRSWDYQRTRTPHGYTADGSFTRYNGSTYDYNARVVRGQHRVGKAQVIRNDSGRVVAARKTVRPRRSR